MNLRCLLARCLMIPTAALGFMVLPSAYAECARSDGELVLKLRAEDEAIREDGVMAAMGDQRWMNAADVLSAAHQRQLAPILKRCGWTFGGEAFGETSRAAWYLVQHSSDLAFQRAQLRQLQLLSQRIPDVPRQELAYLEDRVLLGEGHKQRYGSQLRVENGDLVPAPLADPEEVDRRRATLGLPPLQDYLVEARNKWKAMSGKQ